MLRREPWEKRLHDAAIQIPKLMKDLPAHRDYLNSLRQPAVQRNISYSMNYQLS